MADDEELDKALAALNLGDLGLPPQEAFDVPPGHMGSLDMTELPSELDSDDHASAAEMVTITTTVDTISYEDTFANVKHQHQPSDPFTKNSPRLPAANVRPGDQLKLPPEPKTPSTEMSHFDFTTSSVEDTFAAIKSRQPLDLKELQQVLPPSTPKRSHTPESVLEDQPDEFGIDIVNFRQFFAKYLVPSDATNHTLVILSPTSYRHVFSRTVDKRYLASIVERSQRIMACCLGISSAMRFSPGLLDVQVCNARTRLYADHVTRVHSREWAERIYALVNESKQKLSRGEIEVPSDWNSGDIYLAPESDKNQGTIEALEGAVGAVEMGIDALYSESRQGPDRVFVCIRPPGHHSHPTVPSGFCLINNAHIAVQYAAAKYNVTHTVILDFDLHHGDGTQDICFNLVEKEHKDKDNQGKTKSASGPKIGYFSLHDVNSFPTEPGYTTMEGVKNASVCLLAHDMCVWNVHLEPYANVAEFDKIYKSKYSVIFDKAAQFLQAGHKDVGRARFRPLVIISAGFDASEHETPSMQRHNVSVPTSFFHTFTRDAVKLAQKFDCRILSLLEGGYSDAALSTGVFAHLTGLVDADWQDEWAASAVAKELRKGCSLKYNSASATGDSVMSRICEAIGYGRQLWPIDVRKQAHAATTLAATTGRRVRRGLDLSDERTAEILATPSRVLRKR